MKRDRRVVMSVIWIILGSVLFGLGLAEVVDTFWSSMGSALLAVGVLQVIRFYRYQNDEAYREKMEIEMSDERNLFIRSKAWAWTGYLFILIAGVLVIVLKIMGEELLSMAASYAVCLMLILYWISYMILKKKY